MIKIDINKFLFEKLSYKKTFLFLIIVWFIGINISSIQILTDSYLGASRLGWYFMNYILFFKSFEIYFWGIFLGGFPGLVNISLFSKFLFWFTFVLLNILPLFFRNRVSLIVYALIFWIFSFFVGFLSLSFIFI